MVNTVHVVGDMIAETTREKMGWEPHYHARELVGEDEIIDARKLAVREFAELGKITKEEVGEDGLLKFDPFLEKSTFFGAFDEDNKICAVARLIWNENTTVEDMRLPTEKIDPKMSDYLHDLSPGKLAEFGSLAKIKGTPNIATLKLMREMFAFAGEHEIDQFVCGLEPKLYPAYKGMFGGALQPLNDSNIEFPGIEGEQVPTIIDTREALGYSLRNMQPHGLGQAAVGLAVRYFMRQSGPTVRRRSGFIHF